MIARHNRCVTTAAWWISAVIAGSLATSSATFAQARNACGSEVVFPPDARPYGADYETWAVRYFQWSTAFPATANPAADNAPPDANQAGRVWYLATVTGSRTVTRQITVPVHTALFFTALSIRSNNADCPESTQLTVEELTQQVKDLWGSALRASVTIDGVPLAGLEDLQNTPYLVQTDGYSVTLSDHDNQEAAGGLECIPDGATISPNVARGVFVMVKPLPVGHHTIHITGVAGPEEDPAFVKDVTYQIDVVRH